MEVAGHNLDDTGYSQTEPLGETYTVQIEGKHGIIEMVFPKRPPTEEERIELHRKIAESALRSYNKKETTSAG